MNLVISGHSGSGKTTLIKRILQETDEPIYGFWTEKTAPTSDGRSPVYIHGCQEGLTYAADHRIGFCKEKHAEKFPQVFDTVGVSLLADIPEEALVLMDEIGFMENEARVFQKRVFELMDGNYRIIIAVRDRPTTLLDAIRNHPMSTVITPETDLETAMKVLKKDCP